MLESHLVQKVKRLGTGRLMGEGFGGDCGKIQIQGLHLLRFLVGKIIVFA